MKYNTRFNPTVSGASLHLGHLYLVLVNACEAHRSGGKFIIRIEDTQPDWKLLLGEDKVREYSDKYIQQISEFAVIDGVDKQSEMPSVNSIFGDVPFMKYVPDRMWYYDQTFEWIPNPDTMMFPYTPYLTFERVVYDYYEKVNWIIRGEDLITEGSLYDFFVDVLRIPRMRQTYLPKLKKESRDLLALNVSKTLGTYRLDQQIDRMGSHKILQYLKQSCLKNPDEDFYVDNVKCNPTIIGFDP